MDSVDTSKKGKAVLITGSNRGLGLAVLKGLLERGYKVVLTAYLKEDGEVAYEELTNAYPQFKENIYTFFPLDITKDSDVQACAKFVQETFGQIYILINNAGVIAGENEEVFKLVEENLKSENPIPNFIETIIQTPTLERCDIIFGCNFFGTGNMIQTFLKNNLIEESGKIITVTSSGGTGLLVREDIRNFLASSEITCDQVVELAKAYRKSIENGTVREDGWLQNRMPSYSCSKLLLNAYVKALTNQQDIIDKNIQIYSCCPGWIQTVLGGSMAIRTPEKGAETPLFLVDLENAVNPEIQGKFFYDCKVKDYMNELPKWSD